MIIRSQKISAHGIFLMDHGNKLGGTRNYSGPDFGETVGHFVCLFPPGTILTLVFFFVLFAMARDRNPTNYMRNQNNVRLDEQWIKDLFGVNQVVKHTLNHEAI